MWGRGVFGVIPTSGCRVCGFVEVSRGLRCFEALSFGKRPVLKEMMNIRRKGIRHSVRFFRILFEVFDQLWGGVLKGLPEYERCVSTYILHDVRSAGSDLPNVLWQSQTCASTCSTATLPALVDPKCGLLMFLRFAGRWFSKAIWLVEESGKVTGAEASDVS